MRKDFGTIRVPKYLKIPTRRVPRDHPGDPECKSYKCLNQVVRDGFCGSCYRQSVKRIKIEKESKELVLKHKLAQINDRTMRAWCCHCRRFVEVYYRRYRELGEGSYLCIEASKLNDKTWEKLRYYATHTLMVKWCQACGETKNLHYDHNHDTGRFRGTLCSKCNPGAGFVEDNKDIAQGLASYLHGHGLTQPRRTARQGSVRKHVEYMTNDNEDPHAPYIREETQYLHPSAVLTPVPAPDSIPTVKITEVVEEPCFVLNGCMPHKRAALIEFMKKNVRGFDPNDLSKYYRPPPPPVRTFKRFRPINPQQ